MGPFYALGHLVGLPPWLVQRLWWSVVLLAAFHGLYLLAGRLGLGSPPTRLIAALAYAVSPRIITELGAGQHRGLADGDRALGAAAAGPAAPGPGTSGPPPGRRSRSRSPAG